MNINAPTMSYGMSQARQPLGATAPGPVMTRQDQPGGGRQAGSIGLPAAPGLAPTFAGGAFAGSLLNGLLGLQETAETDRQDAVSRFMAEADADGDGLLSRDEISKQFESSAPPRFSQAMIPFEDDQHSAARLDGMGAAFAIGRGIGSAPSAGDLASRLLEATDADDDGGVTLKEVQSALGEDAASSERVASGFGTLDADGDGRLSADELAAAISAFQTTFTAGLARQKEFSSLAA